MASPGNQSMRKDKKDESFFEKIGTLARKKKTKEDSRKSKSRSWVEELFSERQLKTGSWFSVRRSKAHSEDTDSISRSSQGSRLSAQELEQEGRNAIESPTSPISADLGPEFYLMEDNEERSMLEPHSRDDPKLQELIKMLLDWINDELAENRIIVKDLEEDLFDGQILQKLIEKLAQIKVEAPEVTQSEVGQKQKLRVVLDVVNKILQIPASWAQKWSVESIHSKNIVAILHLLVELARFFRAPLRLPENVAVNVVVVQKKDGYLQTRQVIEEITGRKDDGRGMERDAFDTLFDHAPDKLNVVKKSLITFVNKHLNKVNLEVTDLDTMFHDGVYLVLLMGLLEGYFVPLYCFHLTPETPDQKVHNVAFAFELMDDADIHTVKWRPEDVVNQDLKCTLRVLYNLFTKYKSSS